MNAITSDFIRELSGLLLFKEGKIRQIYHSLEDKEHLLIRTSDRISAFDCLLPNLIPYKGYYLTALSSYWFRWLDNQSIANHFITSKFDELNDFWKNILSVSEIDHQFSRFMLVKKTVPFKIEAVVRGYMTGSLWNEYQSSSSIQGKKITKKLYHGYRLKEPIFTPTTKSESRHDLPLSEEEYFSLIGHDNALKIKNMSLFIYKKATDYAAKRGIIIADTKFEFGLFEEQIILIDECLTPDSSRFWLKKEYEKKNFEPFDKQLIRNYLEELVKKGFWNKEYPAPNLPEHLIHATTQKYSDILNYLFLDKN